MFFIEPVEVFYLALVQIRLVYAVLELSSKIFVILNKDVFQTKLQSNLYLADTFREYSNIRFDNTEGL